MWTTATNGFNGIIYLTVSPQTILALVCTYEGTYVR